MIVACREKIEPKLIARGLSLNGYSTITLNSERLQWKSEEFVKDAKIEMLKKIAPDEFADCEIKPYKKRFHDAYINGYLEPESGKSGNKVLPFIVAYDEGEYEESGISVNFREVLEMLKNDLPNILMGSFGYEEDDSLFEIDEGRIMSKLRKQIELIEERIDGV